MANLYLYAIFHLNLAFSSIEEGQRLEVIRRCYWPLLQLARDLKLPFGIELSGYTLETIASLNPDWVTELRKLCTDHCELIGSGYAQLIGPLVPAEVNRQNLHIGNQTYDRFLGLRPRIALVNEQAYSAGLIQHYLDAGYEAIVMEWDNPASNHQEWDSEWRYFPQIAVGPGGEEIPVIWNNSISFQQFQRYVHGEMNLEKYMALIAKHCGSSVRTYPLYGNDVEIFDFRPGRFTTEAVIEHDEWRCIRLLFKKLQEDVRFTFIPPSELLSQLHEPGAGNRLQLESPAAPIPVKKQEKYNVTRWAVTGRDDIGINTACQRIHNALLAKGNTPEEDWRELCYLWSSDFRTHITNQRWQNYLKRLNLFSQKTGAYLSDAEMCPELTDTIPSEITIIQDEHYITIETAKIKIKLNLRKGLAIDSLIFLDVCSDNLCGTLPHGYYDDITSGADFYTGHFVFETPGRPKITDLDLIQPELGWNEATQEVIITALIDTPLGKILKQIAINTQLGAVTIYYEFLWKTMPVGSLRLGHITLNPKAFCQDQLFYRTHNGGTTMETFKVGGKTISHGEPTSFLVSAKQGIGATEGVVEIGDANKFLRIEVDRSYSALLGQIIYKPVNPNYFFRCSFSAAEMDETSKKRYFTNGLCCQITLTALKLEH